MIFKGSSKSKPFYGPTTWEMSWVDRLAVDIRKPLVREQKEIGNQKLTHHEEKEGMRQGGQCAQVT